MLHKPRSTLEILAPPPPKQPPRLGETLRRAAWGVLEFALLIGVAGWGGVGLFLRVSGIRDGWAPGQIIFYSTPWAVLAAAFAALMLVQLRGRTARLAPVSATIVTAALVGWAWTSWRWQVPEANPALDGTRVVAWNVSRPGYDFGAISRTLHSYDADVIALAEWQPRRGARSTHWRTEFPRHQLLQAPGNMALLVRGRGRTERVGVLAYGSFFGLHRVELPGQKPFKVLQADVVAIPHMERRASLEALFALAQKSGPEPIVILGDLNTPRDSVHFDAARLHFQHAFETAGQGYAHTWPMPLPVVGLDQIWAGKTIRVLSCRHGFSVRSDHRPVIAELLMPR